MKFELPKLPYEYNALEPFIDTKTMEIHHKKHHQGYVTKLNKALENHPLLQEMSLETLLMSLDTVPREIRAAVKNNGGGHYNHSFFWQSLTPKKTSGGPSGELASAIDSDFESFANFKTAFEKKASNHFASGWAWLCANSEGKLSVQTLRNHEWPVSRALRPILVLDLWEHAYYLKYQDRRKEYISSFWNIINWDMANRRLVELYSQWAKVA